MHLSLPFFMRGRLGRRRPSRHGEADDPADMGTDFGLEARLAARPGGAAGRPAASHTAAHDEAPLGWLGGPATRRR